MPNTTDVFLIKQASRFLTTVLLLISISWILFAFYDRDQAALLTRDDRLIQWSQFCFLIAASFYCLKCVLKIDSESGKTLIKVGFSFLFLASLFLALEEISWGQRVFNIQTPEYVKKFNKQNEINLHNHVSFQRYRHWLIIFFGAAGLALIYLEKYLLKLDTSLGFFAPPKFLEATFYLILLCGIAREASHLAFFYTRDEDIREIRWWTERYTELGELNISIAAFLYAYYKYKSICFEDHVLFTRDSHQ